MAKIKVTVERINGTCNLPHLVGDHFLVDGSRLHIPEGGHVCIWALQSMMPIFPILSVKDRLDAGHWIGKVKTFSCPDPQGLVQFRLETVDDEKSASKSDMKKTSRAPQSVRPAPGRRKSK